LKSLLGLKKSQFELGGPGREVGPEKRGILLGVEIKTDPGRFSERLISRSRL
jgi:hypothetical protein